MKTVEEKKLMEELLKVDGEVRYTHDSSFDGKRESIAIVKIDDKYYYGNAIKSHDDEFSKKIARVITLGRAIKNYKKGIEYKHQERIDLFYKKNNQES